jgi:membrane protein DedA with SNARE-associated domain
MGSCETAVLVIYVGYLFLLATAALVNQLWVAQLLVLGVIASHFTIGAILWYQGERDRYKQANKLWVYSALKLRNVVADVLSVVGLVVAIVWVVEDTEELKYAAILLTVVGTLFCIYGRWHKLQSTNPTNL